MNIKEQLMRDEGDRLKVYKDSLGYLTVGIGHKVVPADNLQLGDTISVSQRDAFFVHDLQTAESALSSHLVWTQSLDEARRGALINLCFNLGFRGLLEFRHMLAAAEHHDWQRAAAELLNSKAEHQEPARIERLAKQLEFGVWT